jgi:hypothetical protein
VGSRPQDDSWDFGEVIESISATGKYTSEEIGNLTIPQTARILGGGHDKEEKEAEETQAKEQKLYRNALASVIRRLGILPFELLALSDITVGRMAAESLVLPSNATHSMRIRIGNIKRRPQPISKQWVVDYLQGLK